MCSYTLITDTELKQEDAGLLQTQRTMKKKTNK